MVLLRPYIQAQKSILIHAKKLDDPYWTSRKNSLELIELSSINKVSLV